MDKTPAAPTSGQKIETICGAALAAVQAVFAGKNPGQAGQAAMVEEPALLETLEGAVYVALHMDFREGLRGSALLLVSRQDILSEMTRMDGAGGERDLHSPLAKQLFEQAAAVLAGALSRETGIRTGVSDPESLIFDSESASAFFSDGGYRIFAPEGGGLYLVLDASALHDLVRPGNPEEPRPDAQQEALGEAAAASVQTVPAGVRTQVHPVRLQSFDRPAVQGGEQKAHFELIEDLPLRISVEVGKARKTVKEIISMSVGSLIELDKQADDPVDIIVSGQLIARGEVVVIDENFGVRITEIVNDRPLQKN